jgi:CRP/FNR family transcriptional regulator, cyclic AMP receptor protein
MLNEPRQTACGPERVLMKNIFNQTELAELCGRAELVSVRPGEFLFREDDQAYALYIVKAGSLRIMSGSLVYETVTAGGVVGEMALIDEGAPRSASILAATYAELWEINTDKFRSMVTGNPDFALMIMRVMARRLRIMNQRYRPRPWENAPPAHAG